MLPTLPVLEPPTIETLTAIIRPAEETLQPKQHTVIAGDIFERVAKSHTLTNQRLFDANPHIDDPNIIKPGEVLTIPLNTDVLTHREMPSTISVGTPLQARRTAVTGGSSIGNTYSPGYCTWHVKNLRPDIPNGLGNASSWFSNAQRQGLAVGNTPKVGAVAVTIGYSHVSYVTAVHGSTVTISEMNYRGRYIISSREAPISEFRYIY